MKKPLTLVPAVVLMLALAACNSGDAMSSPSITTGTQGSSAGPSEQGTAPKTSAPGTAPVEVAPATGANDLDQTAPQQTTAVTEPSANPTETPLDVPKESSSLDEALTGKHVGTLKGTGGEFSRPEVDATIILTPVQGGRMSGTMSTSDAKNGLTCSYTLTETAGQDGQSRGQGHVNFEASLAGDSGDPCSLGMVKIDNAPTGIHVTELGSEPGGYAGDLTLMVPVKQG